LSQSRIIGLIAHRMGKTTMLFPCWNLPLLSARIAFLLKLMQ